MAKDENITIRCSTYAKNMFNSLSEKEADMKKGELFEEMIKSYISVEVEKRSYMKTVIEQNRIIQEYLALLVNTDSEVPTNVASLIDVIHKEPQCDRYIRMKLEKEK